MNVKLRRVDIYIKGKRNTMYYHSLNFCLRYVDDRIYKSSQLRAWVIRSQIFFNTYKYIYSTIYYHSQNKMRVYSYNVIAKEYNCDNLHWILPAACINPTWLLMSSFKLSVRRSILAYWQRLNHAWPKLLCVYSCIRHIHDLNFFFDLYIQSHCCCNTGKKLNGL